MLCEYSCGQEAKYQLKNRKWCCSVSANSCPSKKKKSSRVSLESWNNPEIRLKLIKSQTEAQNKLEVKERRNRAIKEALSKPEVRKKRIEIAKENWKNLDYREKVLKSKKRAEVIEKQRKYMLNGGSAKANSFVRNPSKKGVEFRELVLEIFPTAEPEFKILNYSVDIAIKEYKIALEYDGWYHFNCQESINYHNRREKEIRTLGWKFIRYNIFQKFPLKDQVRESVNKIINL